MKENMLTYILREQETNLSIVKNRKCNLLQTVKSLDPQQKTWTILATGSSSNAIEASKYYVENIAKIKVEILMPYTFNRYYQAKEESNLTVFGVSQSGKSMSTIEAMKKSKVLGANNITLLTSDTKSPAAIFADNIIDIGCGEEKVGYVTMGFSATVLTFMLLGLEAALYWGVITTNRYEREIISIVDTIKQTNQVISYSLDWYKENKQVLIDKEHFVIVGYGPGYGVAKEAALKMTETIRYPALSYELEEYMHGPFLALRDSTVTFLMETLENQDNRVRDIEEFNKKISKTTYLITCNSEKDESKFALDIIVPDLLSALLYVIPFQVLSFLIAEEKGNNLAVEIYPDFIPLMKSKAK
ncbi:SIS domain-containing protein [Bacillus sp. PK3-056]|uniref:SIS domain-containing protein n=1 Tax=Niallia circulans TaxID=1397 RepID=A0AA91TT98_NIACI|nr:SIS domain-containing protein [Niallia circulans]AYV73700.1 SIS domain-containing protein [Niallia circulans]PAD83583.1 hypothetical protein CHH57_08970 [Niallia circulans]